MATALTIKGLSPIRLGAAKERFPKGSPLGNVLYPLTSVLRTIRQDTKEVPGPYGYIDGT